MHQKRHVLERREIHERHVEVRREALLNERDCERLDDEDEEAHRTHAPREADRVEQAREHDGEDDPAERGARDDLWESGCVR